MSILTDDEIATNQILLGEVGRLVEYENKMMYSKRANANFDLLVVLKAHQKESDTELDQYIEIGKSINCRFCPFDRQRAIFLYKQKKKNRRNLSYIRYTVRKELASKRLRYKGKFIKKPRLDLQSIVNEVSLKANH